MWTIYKHTNKINGKVYIGQTIQKDLNKRWENGKGYFQKGQEKFGNAIKKYGWNNFKHEILESNIPTIKLANEREMFYIAQYNSVKKGYNTSYGGNNREHLGIPIIQIDINTLRPIKEWATAIEASEKLGIYAQNIGEACLNKNMSSGGYYWCFKKDFNRWTEPKSALHYNLTRSEYDIVLFLLKKYALEKISRREILKQLKEKGVSLTYKQLDTFLYNHDLHIREYWTPKEIEILKKYYSKYGAKGCKEKFNLNRSQGTILAQARKLGLKCESPQFTKQRKVLCVELNKAFDSVVEASKNLHVPKRQISEVCLNKKYRHTAGGYHWKYI